MVLGDDSDLIDLAYEAAFDSRLWIEAMEAFADRIGGNSATLSGLDMRSGQGAVMTARIDPMMVERYFDHYALRNPLSNVRDVEAYLRDWKLKILTDEDWMPRDELAASEYFNDFMLPQDVGGCLMIRLAARDANVFAMTINRPVAGGRFADAQLARARRLHPHLVRAFGLSRKFAEDKMFGQAVADTLERSDHAAFVLETGGRVRRLNRKAEALLREPGGLRIIGGQLAASHPETNRTLRGLIAQSQTDPRRGGAMALPTITRRMPLSLTVSPLRTERLAVFDNRPCTLVTVTDLDVVAVAPEDQMRRLFGLTRSEARVAGALFEGLSTHEIAERLGVSFNTVRSQLSRVYEKTGVRRQAELVRMMMRIVGGGAGG